ncbi:hypothetical protein ZWY2020_040863 [Hordeum vulgare]|nr:hypothetical protein ZWY2020_040863 [Hordeum vulgare]
MAYVPREALRRPASSSCKVVGTPAMEAEAHRLRSSALVQTAVGHFSGISVDLVARAVERELQFPASDFVVAPFFPEDFLLTMFQPAQRDMALERRSISVAGVMFKLRPWLPPAGTSRIWRYYCRVAIEKLPLTAWDWDSIKEVLGKDCELDLIERQSTTNQAKLLVVCFGLGIRTRSRGLQISLFCRGQTLFVQEISCRKERRQRRAERGHRSQCLFTWMSSRISRRPPRAARNVLPGRALTGSRASGCLA